MNSQDIFKAIITDDNITLLEAVYSTLYEKSNLLVEEYKINVAENILTEKSEYSPEKYKEAKKIKRRKFLFAMWKDKHG